MPGVNGRVIVVGAGLSGLAAANRLQELGADVLVLDAASRTGGVIGSSRRDGFLLEDAANSFAAPRDGVLTLMDRTGLTSRHLEASPAARYRYIVRNGSLVPVPLSPVALLQTPLLSGGAKLRMAREAFIDPAPDGVEESIATFVRRRFGQEPLDYLANPFVAGVYAGDPELLSLPQCFPTLRALEQKHGSVLKGMFASGGGSHGPLWSFPDGLGEIPTTLTNRLREVPRLLTRVTAVAPADGRWRITVAGGGALQADAVVWTAPAHQAAALMNAGPALSVAAQQLRTVMHPSVTRVALGFRRENVGHALDGFGALVPAKEQRNVLGVLFSSTLFPGRAPAGHVLLTVFVGGARQPALAELPDDKMAEMVLADLRTLLNVSGPPVMTDVLRWPQAIPQYHMGYGRVREAIASAEQANPGFVFAGTYKDGISVGDALASGLAAAEQVAAIRQSAGVGR